MTEGQQVALDKYGAKYLIEPPRGIARESIAAGWRLDLAEVFHEPSPAADVVSQATEISGTDPAVAVLQLVRPVVLEIGIGRGENIVAAAAQNPETDFIGVEVYGPGIARTILQAEQIGGLPNLRLIQADAPELLEALPASSLTEIWIFFPDPWPKTRHLKRRLIDPDFADQVAKVLKPQGIVRFATDWLSYAEQIAEVFGASAAFTALGDQGRFEGRTLTTFEAKGLRAGRTVTDLAFVRV